MSGNNYSLHSIVAAYGIGLAPHGYYFVKMMANAKGQASNTLYALTSEVMNYRGRILTHKFDRPRENLTNLKGHIPIQVWDTLARARGAHLNALESLPIFAVAMVCQFSTYYPVTPYHES